MVNLMKQHTFELSDSGKEFPARFGGQSITYDYPDSWQELLDTQMPEGVSADSDEGKAVLLNAVMSQSHHLNKQKAAKAFLGAEVGEKDNKRYKYGSEGEIADLIVQATKIANDTKLPKPGAARGEGVTTKLAKSEASRAVAEKKAEQATASIREMYLKLPRNARGAFGADLVERGVFTQEELDELNKQ